jgi:putative ABC transport system ATP-binding protein
LTFLPLETYFLSKENIMHEKQLFVYTHKSENSSMMKIIDVQHLTKIYKESELEVIAVNDVSMQIQQGEFTAIVGPSGSGKTTLLNLLGGLDKPNYGNIWIDGIDITLLPESKLTNFRLKNIGFVFQSYNLIPVLTAYENTEFIMQLQGIPYLEREKRAKDLLVSVGLGDRMNSRPIKLSGGQQQRVAIARALAPKPKFILADEPTANLDSKSADILLDMMDKLNKEEKMTFIFSTHDPRVVKKARRVITLVDGGIASDNEQEQIK